MTITCAICFDTDERKWFKECIKCKKHYCKIQCLSTVLTDESRNCGCPDVKKLNRSYFTKTQFNYNCRCGFCSYTQISCCTDCTESFDKLNDISNFYKYL